MGRNLRDIKQSKKGKHGDLGGRMSQGVGPSQKSKVDLGVSMGQGRGGKYTGGPHMESLGSRMKQGH